MKKVVLSAALLVLFATLCNGQRSKTVDEVLKAPPLKRSDPVKPGEAEFKPPVRPRTELLFADGAGGINDRARKSKLVSLKGKKLGSDDLEFRVWIGFGLKPLEGFVISRIKGNWQGLFLKSINRTVKPPFEVKLSAPKSGWEGLWKQLVEEHVLTLPDFSELEDEVMVNDGTSYVVEIKTEGKYQTYAYLNPDYQKWPEAKQMLKIASILYKEFFAY